jgi:hypothetical protein
MSKLLLFKGDNGIHEFWESAKSELLIFKNHGSKTWVAVKKEGGAVLQEHDLDIVLKKLKEQHDINAVLDKGRHWVKDETKDKMVLKWTHVL